MDIIIVVSRAVLIETLVLRIGLDLRGILLLNLNSLPELAWHDLLDTSHSRRSAFTVPL
jgi:hypothetical protein